MNVFYEPHKNSIRFQYRCFDRILLNGLIQPFQQEERVVGFFGTYRDLYPVSRDVLREIATQFQNWVINRSKKWGAPVLDAPEGRRDDFVQQYFIAAKPDQVVCILKAREPARIMTAIGTKKENRWHLELKQRWVNQYNFYINDSEWGRSIRFSFRRCWKLFCGIIWSRRHFRVRKTFSFTRTTARRSIPTFSAAMCFTPRCGDWGYPFSGAPADSTCSVILRHR
jgi:hypothetical protein